MKAPQMKDLNADNITENTIGINSQGPDERLKYVMERLVIHLHNFARETRLSTKEWMVALNFLTRVGQTCSDVRQVRLPNPLERRFPTAPQAQCRAPYEPKYCTGLKNKQLTLMAI
jgi:hypothetical protein